MTTRHKKPYFEGYYYKHQVGNQTISFITVHASDESFIQVITNTESFRVPYTKNNLFSSKGIKIDINEPNLNVKGKISYKETVPISYDIMGPFRYFPMECRHSIISMYHKLIGNIKINNELIDFTGGVGYIEKDSGRSFPKSYTWVQCNDFPVKASVMAAVSDIPFYGILFKGCICVIWFDNIEYRMATYLGVKILVSKENQLILLQGNLLLQIDITGQKGQKLFAPENGLMTRIIHESASTKARFRFHKDNKLIFDFVSNNCSYEFVPEK
ncbi:MAG: tocopherol cyclase family protein [Eubacteriales bacterium]